MKVFADIKQHAAAIEHAIAGGQALYLLPRSWAFMQKRTPACFKRGGATYIGKIYDQDRTRLVTTARKLGVRVILVEREGQPAQHIDLCGKPLERAQAQAARHEILMHELPLGQSRGGDQ